jgi:hypothetical protein
MTTSPIPINCATPHYLCMGWRNCVHYTISLSFIYFSTYSASPHYKRKLIFIYVSQQQALGEWVKDKEREEELHVMAIGCSHHLHSMLQEVRAICYMREKLSLKTSVILVNPDTRGSDYFGEECMQVTCTAEELF